MGFFSISSIGSCFIGLGLLYSLIYSILLYDKLFLGQLKVLNVNYANRVDLSYRESFISGLLIVICLWLGLLPNSFFSYLQTALLGLLL